MSEDKKENAETPVESPATEQTPETETVEESVKGSQPAEEVTETFDSLSGGAQERFRTILKERNALKEQLASQAQQDAATVQPPVTQPRQNEVAEAARVLKEQAGMVTRDDLNSLYWTIENNKAHESLESKYDGSDGKPKYVKEEVEDYARQKNLGNNFQAAYRDMYFDELTDVRTKETRKKVVTEKPGLSKAQQNPLTLQSFREKLSGPKGAEYLTKLQQNPEAFDQLVSELQE